MSTRAYAQQIVIDRQAKLDAEMVDRNGKTLVVGDVVQYKQDERDSKFLWMGKVLGGYRNYRGKYYVMVSNTKSSNGFKLKFPHNIRKANRNYVVLFKLENS